jgi:hypothetical protein
MEILRSGQIPIFSAEDKNTSAEPAECSAEPADGFHGSFKTSAEKPKVRPKIENFRTKIRTSAEA